MTDLPNTPTWHTGAYRNNHRDPGSGKRNWIALVVFLSGLAGGFSAHELYKQNSKQELSDVWQTDPFAVPSFQLDAPSLAGLQKDTYVSSISLRRWTSEWREWGQTAGADRDFTVSLLSFPRENPYFHSPLIAELKTVRRLKKLRLKFGYHFDDLMTRHGRFRTVDFTINADGNSKRCIAFHSPNKSRNWYMKGWYCAEVPVVPDPSHIACLIDKVKLSSQHKNDTALPSQCQGSGKHANSTFGPVNAGSDPAG